jgi:hypothetical protein
VHRGEGESMQIFAAAMDRGARGSEIGPSNWEEERTPILFAPMQVTDSRCLVMSVMRPSGVNRVEPGSEVVKR